VKTDTHSGQSIPSNTGRATIYTAGFLMLLTIAAAADISFEFKKWSEAYARTGNPLLIPEAAGGAQGAANVFYAVGHHSAIGYSPFAIDGAPDSQLTQSYDVLAQLAPLI
jgi:hypothetical protein